jgi:uncharacterized protein YjbI with pentapeptide repeats
MRTNYGLMLLAFLAPLPALSDSAANMQTLSLTKNCDKCTFSGDDFSLKNFSGFKFNETHFTDVNFSGADLSGANFSNTDFSGAKGQGSNFSKSFFAFYNIGKGDLIAVFKNSDLRGSKFDDMTATLSDATMFEDVKLDGATFTNATFYISGKGTLFLRSVAKGSDFSGFSFDGGLDSGAISSSDFSDSNFSGARMSGVKITDSKFINANLEGAVLSASDLSRSDFSGANLKGVDLTDANLTGTNLCNAIGPDGTKLFIGCP